MSENRVSGIITADNLDNIQRGLSLIKANLPPLIDLTPEGRHTLLKMGEKSDGFVRKALNLALKNDAFLPRAFAVPEMKKDVDLYFALQPILADVRRLAEAIDDTLLEVGSEAYVAALTVYRSAKENGQGEALDGDLDEMGKKFARRLPKDTNPTPKPPEQA